MSDLAQQELIRIRRAAEDAAYAMNRNYKPFIDVVSHPLNIIALVDMAQKSIKQQSKVDELQNKLAAAEERASICLDYKNTYLTERDELQKRLDAALKILSSKKKMYVDMFIELEQALKGGSDE